MAALYQPSGYIDFIKCEALSSALNIMIGPRNAGKTFSALLHFTRVGVPFAFMRTTKTQIDLVFSPEMSPFNKLNDYEGTKYWPEKLPKTDLIGIYDNYEIDEKGKVQVSGSLRGYCFSLSQVGATRGFNLDQVQVLIYDEFVAHAGEMIQGKNQQFQKYADIVFTINRTRELEGKPVIKQWLMGNSDDLSNNILCELGLVRTIINMKKAGENYIKLPERDISIFLLDDSPVAQVLSDHSALSKIFAGSEYVDMAFKNEFIHDDYSDCYPIDIHPYAPLMRYGNIVIYQHKRKEGYYVREVRPDAVFNGIPSYAQDSRSTLQAREDFAGIYFCWLVGIVSFDSYETKLKFMKLYNIK